MLPDHLAFPIEQFRPGPIDAGFMPPSPAHRMLVTSIVTSAEVIAIMAAIAGVLVICFAMGA